MAEKIKKSLESKIKPKQVEVIKNHKGKVVTFIFLALFLAMVLIAAGMLYLRIGLVSKFETPIPTAEVIREEISQQPNDDIQILMERIISLEKAVKRNNDYLKTLQIKINDLETRLNKISLEPQKLELIRLVLDINRNVENKMSYANNLALLKPLVQSNAELADKVKVLELYQNNFPTDSTISKDFASELGEFLKETNALKTNGDNLSKFLSNFMVVRKINSDDENSADFFIAKLEDYMNSKNYSRAFETIQNSQEYIKYFPKTLEDLRINILLNITAREMLDYLVNN